MASDVVMPVLAADDLGLRTDAFNVALVDTYGFQLNDATDSLLVHAYLSGSFVEALPLPAWSLLILLLWSTSVVHNFAHVFHIRPQLRGGRAFRVLPAVVLGATALDALTLFSGGILLVFYFTLFVRGGSILTLSNPYQCPSLEGQEQNQ